MVQICIQCHRRIWTSNWCIMYSYVVISNNFTVNLFRRPYILLLKNTFWNMIVWLVVWLCSHTNVGNFVGGNSCTVHQIESRSPAHQTSQVCALTWGVVYTFVRYIYLPRLTAVTFLGVWCQNYTCTGGRCIICHNADVVVYTHYFIGSCKKPWVGVLLWIVANVYS